MKRETGRQGSLDFDARPFSKLTDNLQLCRERGSSLTHTAQPKANQVSAIHKPASIIRNYEPNKIG
jgi:hypothetical protein